MPVNRRPFADFTMGESAAAQVGDAQRSLIYFSCERSHTHPPTQKTSQPATTSRRPTNTPNTTTRSGRDEDNRTRRKRASQKAREFHGHHSQARGIPAARSRLQHFHAQPLAAAGGVLGVPRAPRPRRFPSGRSVVAPPSRLARACLSCPFARARAPRLTVTATSPIDRAAATETA